jgi:alkylhydroperoxidase family enzyme
VELPAAVLADPRGVRADLPRMRMLVELATLVTEQPWSLSHEHRERALAAGLDDADLLHAISLSSYFGHLNRIADTTGVPLDYDVRELPPHPDPTVAPWSTAPRRMTARPAIDLAIRPATAQALTEWKTYMFHRDSPLTRRQRTLIARWVAVWLGDGGISSPADLTVNPLDDSLRALAELVTLAPWRVNDGSFAALRAAGFDDATLFDACATASSAGVFSRLAVALASLGC